MRRVIAALSAGLMVGTILVATEAAEPTSASTVVITIKADCSSAEKLKESLENPALNPDLQPAGEGGRMQFFFVANLDDTFEIESTVGTCTATRGPGVIDGITVGTGTPISATTTFTIKDSTDFGLAASTGDSIRIWIDACTALAGTGIQQDPWQVGEQNHFFQIGKIGCAKWGHYRQTRDFEISTPAGSHAVTENFHGVYDGDHRTITILDPARSDSPSPTNGSLFNGLWSSSNQKDIPAVIKKLRVAGRIVTNETSVGGLVRNMQGGGVISEVRSSVQIEVNTNSSFGRVGGLVAVADPGTSPGSTSGGLIQYSSFSGSITFTSTVDVNGQLLGGLVADGEVLWIRDSYSTGIILHTAPSCVGKLAIGGLLGEVDNAGGVQILRSYAAGALQHDCADSDPDVFVGGLIGRQQSGGSAAAVASSFWLSSISPKAFGNVAWDPANAYATVGGPSVPVAVPVSASVLRTLSTFQSREGSGALAGQPSGVSDLVVAASPKTGSAPFALTEADYRWAIENDVNTFVAQRREVGTPGDIPISRRGETVDYSKSFNRLLWSSSPVPEAQYRTQDRLDTVRNYPPLGRVWEICSSVNNGFPVLVWEEHNCSSGGTGGGGADRNREEPVDTELAAALAAGLSGAELQAFLASGLTLEQWLAQRLATTGTPGEALNSGLLLAAMLSILGIWLVMSSRRLTTGRLTRSRP